MGSNVYWFLVFLEIIAHLRTQGQMLVVKIMVPFWVPIIVRHLIFRVPKRDHNFDNHPDPFLRVLASRISR